MGAVPLKAAKRWRVGKRPMSPVTPTPRMSITGVPRAAPRRARTGGGPPHCWAPRRRATRPPLRRRPSRGRRRLQVARHGVQAAGDLGPGARQVRWRRDHSLITAAWSLGADFLRRRRAEGGDGHRQRVVGVVLVGRLGPQQPHPGRQLRLHVQAPLTGGDELLRQEVRGWWCSRSPRCAPGTASPQQPLQLLVASAHA